MAFVNINVREQKLEQYDFSLLEKVSRIKSPHSSITIDAERDIWLRKVYTLRLGDPREEIGPYVGDFWGFYWKGIFFVLETFESNTQGMGTGEHLSYHAKVRVLTTPEILGDKTLSRFDSDTDAEKAALLPFPKTLEDQKLEILKDLKAALEAYAGGGVLSESSGCTVELEFQGVTL
jgi:hypothetical protein